MAELTYRDAVAAGIAQEMRRDPNVVFLGEDLAAAGGVFKTTVGLLDQFGPDRVRDTPISEQAILGAAMGAAMTGIPVMGGATRWFVALITSAALWFVIGAVAARRSSRRPATSWREWRREWLRLAVGIWAGALVGIAVAGTLLSVNL